MPGSRAVAVRVSEGLPFNPLVAIDLSWGDGFCDFRTETFVRCWNENVDGRLSELALAGPRLQNSQLAALTREVAASPWLLEDVLGCYFEELVSGGELAARGVDETSWALDIAAHLQSGPLLWKTRVELYKHTWKFRRLYNDSSAVSLTPLYQIIDRTVPEWSCASHIYQLMLGVDALDEIYIPDWIAKHGIKLSVANIRLINFVLYNDTRFVSSAAILLYYLRLNSYLENFDSVSAHYDFGSCVAATGLSLRDGLDPSAVKLRVLSHDVVDHFRPTGACDEADKDELALKAFMRSKEPGQPVQGIPAATHRLIIQTIRDLGRIVSVRDIRRLSAANRLRFDPFQLDPGPLVIYAPGDRHLYGDAVSFALREWVQDDAHKKGRIAPDRILTPLRTCPIATDAKIRDLCIETSVGFKRWGVVFRQEACRVLVPQIDRQGLRWAHERTLRAIDATLSASGLVRLGDVFFDKVAWDLRDAKQLTPAQIRHRIETALADGQVPQAAMDNSDFRDRLMGAI